MKKCRFIGRNKKIYDFKYIRGTTNGDQMIIIFHKWSVHDDVYRRFFHRKGLISAGFIGVNREDWTPIAYGGSDSITNSPNNKALPEDTEEIKWAMAMLGLQL